ncbi:sigma-70 family RNA polymerase sigma factor [Dokdonella sp.]|uniref:RNA polymerase sigma factor n=1 Tax=Dokdonella sp. TaxID=2291710 RepID=UPI001B22CEE7|nr:sigma-70 family RNA polymerase sigma factor [Dokdonella sp.]MBO9664577.1 sigma-70 family RNA polymerase sigma factor [Dokdonella sp.]
MPDSPRPSEWGQDDGRLERFVRERQQPLLRFLLRMNVPEHDAQDIAQESMVRLLRYSRSEPAEAWQALLYRIAINLLRDRKRRSATEQERRSGVDFGVVANEAVSHEPSPEQHASHRQALVRMQAAVQQLPQRCREVYLLHRIEGMTYPEIARRSGVSAKAVEKNISRALRLLREQFEATSARNPDDVI